MCVSASGEGVADNNAQPLNDISNGQAVPATLGGYLVPSEVLNVRPPSYQELPSLAGSVHDYEIVDGSSSINRTNPYEQLNVDAQRTAVYDHLAIPNNIH